MFDLECTPLVVGPVEDYSLGSAGSLLSKRWMMNV